MKALAYHVPVDGMESHASLAGAWKDLTKQRGYDADLLHYADTAKHRSREVLERKIATFPTVNDRTYEAACYLRWLAYGKRLGHGELGLLTDYDVLILANPADLGDTPCVFDAAPVCSASLLTGRLCHAFADYLVTRPDGYAATQVNGRPHTSDMYLFTEWAKLIGLPRHPTIEQKSPAESDWKGAKLIHFATDANYRTFGHNNKRQLLTEYANALR